MGSCWDLCTQFRVQGLDSTHFDAWGDVVGTQGLQCSSFLVMACFLLRDYNILPKKELHSSPWVGGYWATGIPYRSYRGIVTWNIFKSAKHPRACSCAFGAASFQTRVHALLQHIALSTSVVYENVLREI